MANRIVEIEDEPDGRRMIYVGTGDRLFKMTIGHAVILRAMEIADELGIPITPDEVSELSGQAAANLIEQGWFTEMEYVAWMAVAEMDEFDAEIGDVLGP